MPPLSPCKKSCLALGIAQSLTLATAHAATIEVTSTLDDGTACTLREAIATTNAGSNQSNGCTIDTNSGPLGSNDTIVFGASVSGDTIGLNGNALSISSDVSINPAGSRTTITANNLSRVFEIPDDSIVSLNNLIITGGNSGGNADGSPGFLLPVPGGGIAIAGQSDVTLTNSSVSGNTASSSGGGKNPLCLQKGFFCILERIFML